MSSNFLVSGPSFTESKPQKRYCCSSGCTEVSMDYQRMGDSDRCTKTKTTCLYACKHNNAGGGFRLCNYTPETNPGGINTACPPQ